MVMIKQMRLSMVVVALLVLTSPTWQYIYVLPDYATSNIVLASASPVYMKQSTANVNDFGAKGDGRADDTAAIQDAINSANVIYFAPGNYKISSYLALKSNVSIIGNGATLNIDSQNNPTNIFYGRKVRDVAISDLNIIGSALDKNGGFGSSSNSYLYAIHFSDSSNIRLDNIYGKCLDYFIKFDQDVYDVKVTRLRCELTVMPTFIGPRCSDITITDCEFNQPDRHNYTLDHRNHPFYLLNCHDIKISNIHLSGGMGFAIVAGDAKEYHAPPPYNIAYTNVVIEDSWGEPIWINGANDVTIDGLTFKSKQNSGRMVPHISVYGSNNIMLSNFEFSGGNWTTNGAPNILMRTSENVNFSNIVINGVSIFPK